MQNVYSFLYCLILMLSSSLSFSQIQTKGLPHSIKYHLQTEQIPTCRYTTPNLAAIQREDAINDIEKGKQRLGVIVPLEVDFFEKAAYLPLSNGKYLYRLAVPVYEAEALSFFFKQFEILPNDEFYIFNEKGTEIQGAFTSIDNSSYFGTGLIGGEKIILEYISNHKINHKETSATIILKEIGYAYRFTNKQPNQRDFGDADNCEVNINCSEGDGWQEQRDAVVRILVKEGNSQFWCTGTLINNLKQDCTPYILTAEHCGENATDSDINQWIFYFNYQAPSCSNPPSEGTLASQFLTGATKIAQSNDGGGNTGSDFMLLEINNAIPESYNPYYAGWDANNTTVTGGVCIHHPDGDIKKISTFLGATNSTSFTGNVPNTHWGVTWSATENGHGVTEAGSSGSPLFNSDKRIIGTLTGGAAFCSNTNGQDEYGKMSYHWISNGNSAINQLQPWLDPENTNTLIISGSPNPCDSTTTPPNDNFDLKLYPNPVAQSLTVEWHPSVSYADIRVLDMVGRELGFITGFPNQGHLDVGILMNGVYILEIYIQDLILVEKIVVSRK